LSSNNEQGRPEQSIPHMAPEVHLRDYIAVVLRHMKLVAAIAIAFLALSVLKLWSTEPEYRATMLVRVGPHLGPKEIAGPYATYTDWDKRLSTYCQIIKGCDLAKALVEKLGINSYDQLGLSEPEPGILDRVKNWIAGHIATSKVASASAANGKRSPIHFARLVQGRIGAEALRDTNLIQISYVAEEPRKASQICQAVVNSFIEGEQERRLSSAKRWIKWFQQQQAKFEEKVASSEEELLEFHKKVDAYVSTNEGESEVGISALQNTIETLRKRQAEVRVLRIGLDTRLRMVMESKHEGNPFPVNPALLDNPNINNLMQQRKALRRQLALHRMRYGPKHPSTIEQERSLALLEQDIKAEVEQAIDTLRQRINGEIIEEERLAEKIRIAEEQASQVSKKLVEYNALKRKADANWRFFDTIITKAKEADLASDIDSVNIDLISKDPDVSRAPTHGGRTVLLGALFLGLMVGIGLALFVDYMDTSLATPADIERSVDLDQLAMLVHARCRKGNRRKPILAAKDHPDSTLAENFRTLRASILFSPRFRGVRSIVITSSVAGEGKTTVAANLAVALAQAGKKVLLVDADMRKPYVHEMFGLDRKPGLSDFLKGTSPRKDVLRQPDVENLSIVACGARPSKPAELLGTASQKIRELAEPAEDFDYVVFDTPPLTLSDPALVAKSVGGLVVLVIRSGGVSQDVVRRSLDKLREVDAPVAGAVLNNFDVKKQGYYYGYGYRYYDYYYRHHHYYSRESKEEGDGEETKS